MADHVRMTSPMLKAMTHPLRRRIVSLMRPVTSSASISSSATDQARSVLDKFEVTGTGAAMS